MPDVIHTLNTSGFLITEHAGAWAMLTADFGEGYGAAVMIGDPQGTRNWSMKIDVLPDGRQAPTISDDLEPSFLLTESGDGYILTEGGDRILIENDSTRAQYLWRFFRVSKAANDAPFWFEIDDPNDGRRKLFLASFVDHHLSYGVLCAKIYSTGLQLRQRRVAGVTSPILAT